MLSDDVQAKMVAKILVLPPRCLLVVPSGSDAWLPGDCFTCFELLGPCSTFM